MAKIFDVTTGIDPNYPEDHIANSKENREKRLQRYRENKENEELRREQEKIERMESPFYNPALSDVHPGNSKEAVEQRAEKHKAELNEIASTFPTMVFIDNVFVSTVKNWLYKLVNKMDNYEDGMAMEIVTRINIMIKLYGNRGDFSHLRNSIIVRGMKINNVHIRKICMGVIEKQNITSEFWLSILTDDPKKLPIELWKELPRYEEKAIENGSKPAIASLIENYVHNHPRILRIWKKQGVDPFTLYTGKKASIRLRIKSFFYELFNM